MSGFDEVLRDGFDAYVRAIEARGGVSRGRARTAVTRIRRRRALRAGTTTGVAAVATGIVAFGALNLRPDVGQNAGGGPSSSSTPMPTPTPTPSDFPTPPAGAPEWCDLNAYPPVNPAALGDSAYGGRVYADYVAHTYVYVHPDGTRETLDPDDNGDVVARGPDGQAVFYVPLGIPNATRTAFDIHAGGGASGVTLDGVRDPRLLYEWTTTVPNTVPDGVDVAELSQILVASIGAGGTGFDASAVPSGATVESVFRFTDGHERSVKVLPDGIGGTMDDYSRVASVSVRVTGLPNGGTFEITSTRDASKSWSAACTAGDSVPPASVPASTSTPYLEGPESAVFQCLAPLPEGYEDALSTTATFESGLRRVTSSGLTDDSDMNGSVVDFGTRGVLATSSYALSRRVVDFGAKEQPPGWGSQWGNIDQTPSPDGSIWGNGVATFTALAWVDADGVVVGRQVRTTDPDGLVPGTTDAGHADAATGGERDGHLQVSYVVGKVDALAAPCDGVDAATLATASVVWLEGYGPDPDHMTWSWTRVGSETS